MVPSAPGNCDEEVLMKHHAIAAALGLFAAIILASPASPRKPLAWILPAFG